MLMIYIFSSYKVACLRCDVDVLCTNMNAGPDQTPSSAHFSSEGWRVSDTFIGFLRVFSPGGRCDAPLLTSLRLRHAHFNEASCSGHNSVGT